MDKGPNASIGAQRLFVWLAIAGALLFAVAWAVGLAALADGVGFSKEV